jgi:hypothetical protein
VGPAAPEAHSAGGLERPRRTFAHHRGTVIRLLVETLPSGGLNKPVWLWWSGTVARGLHVPDMVMRRIDDLYPGDTKPVVLRRRVDRGSLNR